MELPAANHTLERIEQLIKSQQSELDLSTLNATESLAIFMAPIRALQSLRKDTSEAYLGKVTKELLKGLQRSKAKTRGSALSRPLPHLAATLCSSSQHLTFWLPGILQHDEGDIFLTCVPASELANALLSNPPEDPILIHNFFSHVMCFPRFVLDLPSNEVVPFLSFFAQHGCHYSVDVWLHLLDNHPEETFRTLKSIPPNLWHELTEALPVKHLLLALYLSQKPGALIERVPTNHTMHELLSGMDFSTDESSK